MTEIHKTIQKGGQIAESLKRSYSLYEIYELSCKVDFNEGQSLNIWIAFNIKYVLTLQPMSLLACSITIKLIALKIGLTVRTI